MQVWILALAAFALLATIAVIVATVWPNEKEKAAVPTTVAAPSNGDGDGVLSVKVPAGAHKVRGDEEQAKSFGKSVCSYGFEHGRVAGSVDEWLVRCNHKFTHPRLTVCKDECVDHGAFPNKADLFARLKEECGSYADKLINGRDNDYVYNCNKPDVVAGGGEGVIKINLPSGTGQWTGTLEQAINGEWEKA